MLTCGEIDGLGAGYIGLKRDDLQGEWYWMDGSAVNYDNCRDCDDGSDETVSGPNVSWTV